MNHTYEIAGMHCQSCVQKLTKALQTVPGITRTTVTLNPPEADLEMSSHVRTETLNSAVAPLGAYSLKEKVTGNDDTALTVAIDTTEESLTPLFVVVAYIVGGVLLRSLISKDFSLHTLMGNFMGGFFVVFSLFKLINLSGFADGCQTYDIIAKRSRGYALAYPFIELGLGVAYLSSLAPFLTNVITFILMTVGSIGVAQALRKKQAIQCACLGTALKLPMTKVTLAEDLLMALMALVMIVI